LLDDTWVAGRPNASPFDAWSGIHVTAGVILAALRVTPAGVVILNIAYEVLEQVIEREKPNLFGSRGPETVTNMATDIAITMLAYLAARDTLI